MIIQISPYFFKPILNAIECSMEHQIIVQYCNQLELNLFLSFLSYMIEYRPTFQLFAGRRHMCSAEHRILVSLSNHTFVHTIVSTKFDEF